MGFEKALSSSGSVLEKDEIVLKKSSKYLIMEQLCVLSRQQDIAHLGYDAQLLI